MLEMEPGEHDTEGLKLPVRRHLDAGWPHQPSTAENWGLHAGLGVPYLVW